MARLKLNMPDDLYDKAAKAADETSIRAAIDSASPILVKSMQDGLASVIRDSGDSDTVKSVTASRAKKAKNGAYIAAVYPKGKSSRPRYPDGSRQKRVPPVSNAMKAAILNYGRKGQPARPWLAKSVNDVRKQVEDRLEKAIEEKMK